MKGEQVWGGDSLLAPISRQMVGYSSSWRRKRTVEKRGGTEIERGTELPTHSASQTGKHGKE